MSWEALCRHGDSEEQVRCALAAEFDARWSGGMGRDIRQQLLAQGCTLPLALEATEQARRFLRNDQADRAPMIMDAMAASAAPRH